MRLPRLPLLARLAFFAAGLAFMALAFAETWDRSRGSVLPSWPSLLVAGALALLGLLAAARGWHALIPAAHRRALDRAFFAAQLGKYIPGGVWQAAGQVGLSAGAGVTVGAAAVAFPVHALTQVAAGGVLGAATAATATHLQGAARWVTLLGVLLVPLLHRGWMVRVVRLIAGEQRAAHVPAQAGILRAAGWSALTILAAGAGFAALGDSVGIEASFASMMFAFALAWTVGFLALPFPAGVGVREAVLIGTLGAAAPVVAASIAVRLVTIVAEAAMVAISRLRAPAGSRGVLRRRGAAGDAEQGGLVPRDDIDRVEP